MSVSEKLLLWLERISAVLMALAILLLPVTSQPQLHQLMGYALVSPPALVFVFLLGATWLPVYLLRRGTLPAEMRPFIYFIIAVVISALLAFFYNIPNYRGITVLSAELDAFLTFAIACGVFIVFSTWFRDIRHLRFAVWLLNISGALLVAWSFAQLYVILVRDGEYFGFMVRVQYWLSVRSLLDHVFMSRVTGFAYEPSWLAHQLNIVYIPFWFAATISGFSVTRKHWRISIENILLAASIVIMFFSFSRIGVLALLLMAGYAFWRLQSLALDWVQKRLKFSLPAWARRLAMIILPVFYAALAIGSVALMSRFDTRIAAIFELDGIPRNVFELAAKVDFAERMVHWANGWQVFAQYPLFGSGPGNTGFFYKQNFPPIANRLNEILYVIHYETYLPNVKSMWMRLLGETGLVGFSLFSVWFFVLWQAGKFLTRQGLPILRLFGWMGLFVIMAFLAEGFSIDSFALPYLWVSLGLVTAASAIARKSSEPG